MSKPAIILSNDSYHNDRDWGERLDKEKTYRNLSTVIICPTRGLIPSRVVANWQYMRPMNQQVVGPIFMEGMEVATAYNEGIKMVLENPGFKNYKFLLTIEEDNYPQNPDGLMKLYEGIDEYDCIGGLYWTKGEQGQPMCFDDKTEVLTTTGWRLFKDVEMTDSVATITEDGILEFHQPIDKQVYEYSGKMLHWSGQMYDQMVTPDHALYCSTSEGQPFKRVTASKMVKARKMSWKKDAMWAGVEQSSFELPNHLYNMDSWLELLGYYLSEGHCPKRPGSTMVDIRQEKVATYALIANICTKMNLNPRLNNGRIQFYDKVLHEYFSKFGKSGSKYVPDYVFDLTPRQIKIFLDALWQGDGSHKNGRWENYYSKSKQLADDVQALLLKVGIAGTLGRNHDNYVVSTVHRNLTPRVTKEVVEVDYDGLVYDLTVPNHTLYIRRNGKSIWSGNCYGDPSIQPLNFIPRNPIPNQLNPCNGLGMGFNLWRLEMFKDKRFEYGKWFKTEQSFDPQKGAKAYTQDLYFFEKAVGFGYKFACDARIPVVHWDEENKKAW